ncbi:MAG: alpha/beta hydrolase [Planctomycetota bacterium]
MSGTSRRVVPRRLLLAIAFVLVVALCGSTTAAWWLTKGWPSPARALPADLRGETVVIPWRHGTLEAWVLHADDGTGDGADSGVVLLLHGWRGSRPWMLDRARVLLRAGYPVVVPDLPAHGTSSGDEVTFGLREGEAVDALLAYTAERFSGRPIAVVAQSLGGAALLMARRDVLPRAVVLESVFATLRDAMASRMLHFLGPLGAPLTPLLETAAGALRGVSPDEVRPIDRIGELDAPLLLMHGSEDRSTPLRQARALYDAARGSKILWEVPGAGHVDLFRVAPEEWERRVLGFLREHLGGQGG